ncbi:SprT-like family protein [Nitzschia inconspicua]|uniref:SprT-like family protein n=1 Tax=Nitzschia inconspicua TaxID=303405 RepID=A0A9K3Q4Q4_9STRA|nr:SprT-like family protein [Nitzschia inconspicua]
MSRPQDITTMQGFAGNESVNFLSDDNDVFVEQVRQRFERYFLPRFGPLWRSMLLQEKENVDSNMDENLYTDYDMAPKVSQGSADFLDAIARKRPVTISVGSPLHDEDCRCGCELPVLDEIIHPNDQSSNVLDDDDSSGQLEISSSQHWTGTFLQEQETTDDDSSDIGKYEEISSDNSKASGDSNQTYDSVFNFDQFRKHLPDTSSGDNSKGGETNSKSNTKGKRQTKQGYADVKEVKDSVALTNENENDNEFDTVGDTESDSEPGTIEIVSSDADESDFEMENRLTENYLKKPSKKTIDNQFVFQRYRDQLTKTTFNEFNRTVFGGALSAVEVNWSKKLKTTAGLTRLRRCKANAKPGVPLKRLACIELSTKVVDSEERLRSTLLHELVHAAVWIVDGVEKPPHGPNFRKWARIAMSRIPNMKVTTTHSYEIDYKYIWKCSNPKCASTVKRHSKSFDPSRYRCGKCKGDFVEAHAFSKSQSQPSAYNTFVKEHSKLVRESLLEAQRKDGIRSPTVSQVDVMKNCAKLWRQQKSNN